jgi:hypothetical protein
MRRLPVIAATVVLATTGIQKEVQDAECKEHSCANDLSATVPEQPHTLEEWPEYRVPEGMIEIPASPVFMVKIGSDIHLDWVRQYGEIPTPVTS